jgi:hypothetical protein
MKAIVLTIALLIPAFSSLCFADDLVDDQVFKSKCVMCHGNRPSAVASGIKGFER